MEKVLLGCFLLILGQIFLLLPAEARQRPPTRSISRGRHTRTRPQTVLLAREMTRGKFLNILEKPKK